MSSNSVSTLTADDFNKHFLEIPDKLAPERDDDSRDPMSFSAWTLPTLEFFSFHAVSQGEMLSAIRGIKSGKIHDYFGLNAIMVKYVCTLIVAPLTILFNLCVEEGSFPDILKIACVTPLYKKGNSEEPSNYRPISILPVISKIFERLLKDQLLCYLEHNNILSENQFGFRPG